MQNLSVNRSAALGGLPLWCVIRNTNLFATLSEKPRQSVTKNWKVEHAVEEMHSEMPFSWVDITIVALQLAVETFRSF